MSQPGRPGSPGRTPAPLRVTSERLGEDEAREAREADAASAAPVAAPARTATATATGPLPVGTPGPASAAPVVAPRPALPVVAPRPRRRWSDLWRLVFARRRAGRHRPETTPPQSWSMISPQRRRRSRWGRY
ncbi:hypothetical protein [Actinomycetospora straminea]|uniref:Uncharacterized protein n=1 Tax=Actinomycetospora straminea TaxID=663607 RepID=A0ABP9EWD3_9PSEU|nr:hypothetical protein [Actinomycetospora straminea]MDD7931784.1 hypothetical protein [Actinomycetospora straminea]